MDASQSRTKGATVPAKSAGALVLAATLAAAAAWPPFLPPPGALDPDAAAIVERVWREPTFTRIVDGGRAAVPFEVYLAFVDLPEVTAAAARHLGLARYEVHVLGPDQYRATDHEGAEGVYRVLVREGGRRVVVSSGRHRGAILGTIEGHAVTVLDFDERDGVTTRRLSAWVLIESQVAAALARLLVPVFGTVVDRKLTEGFRVTERVTLWALQRPAEFCRWLAGERVAPARRAQLDTLVPVCEAGRLHAVPPPR